MSLKTFFNDSAYNETDENFVLDETNKVRTDQQTDKQNLENLIKAKEYIEHLETAEVKLSLG